MKGYLRTIFSLLLLAGVVSVCIPVAFSQEEVVLSKTFSGEISSVDVEKSTAVIKQLKDAENKIYEDITICVNDATIIAKGSEIIGLGGLAIGSNVSVEYKTDESGNNIASLIQVETSE